MSEEKRCWACDSVVPNNATICPNCEMPLEEAKEEIDDIDSFLDDLTDEQTSSESGPEIPSFDDGPSIPSFDEEPSIPSFDESPTTPSFDEETPLPSFGDDTSSSSDFDFDMPTIPDFDGSERLETEEDEMIVAQSVDILPLGAIPLKKKIKFFLPQLFYWSLVFTVVSFAGLRIDNGNFQVNDYNPNYYSLRVELFIFGWLSFIAMGWFYRFKSNQKGIMYSPYYGILYLALQLIMIGVMTFLMLLLVAPTEELMNQNTILATHAFFIFYGFLISGLTFGFFLFFVGYKFYYDEILGVTPISKM